jgi:dihydroneopterin aldolase
MSQAGQGDLITLTGLRLRGRHGVSGRERDQDQDFIVDAALRLDTSAAAASDDLELTADYGTLAVRLAEVVGGAPAELIETLAVRLVAACLTDPRVAEAEVTVHKPAAAAAAGAADASATVRRRRV